ncbi:hypothetical protein EVAR_63747_1 [Eumeta japonica]|uniref:Uncharacterized protein n=1 Tax=Eumeta variegata TaxID=151549 RepID=A0A4C1ZT74_EUMVA|nr:hypothetical protein EVAR_63747_1 [Eumeta japonica]
MSTDKEKAQITKLLINLEVPEIKLTQRSLDLVMEFHKKYHDAIEEEEDVTVEESHENPYKVDQKALSEIDEQLNALLEQRTQSHKESAELSPTSSDTDGKRPRRTNSMQEQVLRVDNELQYHHDKGSQSITPLPEEQIQLLIKECLERNSKGSPISGARLKEVVEQAKKSLPKFQYKKKIENSTALALLPAGTSELPE